MEKNKKNIKTLYFIDLDGTLFDSPMPENGKKQWSAYYGKSYPYLGWWGRPESLDLKVFDIKPFSNVLDILNKNNNVENTLVIALTSRMEKLRPYIQAILDKNHIKVDKLDMKKDNRTKGDKILAYINYYNDLEEINVYDDRNSDIESYLSIIPQIPKNIILNIYRASEGNLTLVGTNKNNLLSIVNEEIQNIILQKNNEYVNYSKK